MVAGFDGFVRRDKDGDSRSLKRPAGTSRDIRGAVASALSRRAAPVLLLLACILASHAATASKPYAPTELDAEAAFLTRLAPFVDWPLAAFSSGKSPLVICAVGTDPLAKRLAGMAYSGKNGKRPIRVRVVGTLDALDTCHILFVGASSDLAMRIARTVRRRPVLTVSRSSGARYQTAMIIFAVDRGRVRFDVDDATAAGSRLTISSKLLALARNVTPPSSSR